MGHARFTNLNCFYHEISILFNFLFFLIND